MKVSQIILAIGFLLPNAAMARWMNPYILTFDCSGPAKFQVQVPYPATLDMQGRSSRPGFSFWGKIDKRGRSYTEMFDFWDNGKIRNRGDERPAADGDGGSSVWVSSIYQDGRAFLEVRTQKFVVTGKWNPRAECPKDGTHTVAECQWLPTESNAYGNTIFKNYEVDLSQPNFTIEVNGNKYNCVGGPHNKAAVESAAKRVQDAQKREGVTAAEAAK